MFPLINHIDDVLPHIQGNNNFSVNVKEDYTVIDYILNTPDLFNNSVEKECRGIIFHKDSGKLLSRRLHKFFNFNERPESSNVDFSKPHVILEKLDGSMITAFMSNGKLTWGSKAGVTFLTPQIEEFVEKNPQYEKFTKNYINGGYTPIFEWCSRKNRIVLDYPEDRLVLIAIRSMYDGVYVPYDTMKYVAEFHELDYVKQFSGSVATMEDLAAQVKGMSGVEGFVVRFDDGHMLKIKADEYVLHHKAKDSINLEKNVIAILVGGTADDFKVLLMDQDRQRFDDFERDFKKAISDTTFVIYGALVNFRNNRTSKKTFALEHRQKFPQIMSSIFFEFIEKDGVVGQIAIMESIIDLIKKNVGSQSSIDKVRSLWNNLSWYDF